MNFGLIFDPVEHRYILDGVTIPNITKVLELTGFVDKTWFKSEHAERGRAVHSACQFLIEGDLDWETVDPAILPRVKAFQEFLNTYKPELVLAEVPLYSKLGFAGTPDLVLRMDGINSVWDIKSGKSGLAAKLQTAAQQILIEEMGVKIEKRFALELPANGKYKPVPHEEKGDKVMFLNALGFVNRRINEGELKI